MTQQDLAAAVGMAQSSVARIETGAVVPRTATLAELLAATGHELAVERRIGDRIDPGPIRQRLRLPVPQRKKRAMTAARMRADPTTMLRRLRRARVRFVVVGSWAEMAHGSTLTVAKTVEVCHADDSVSLERLAAARSEAADVDNRRLTTFPMTTAEFGGLWRNAVELNLDASLPVRVAALEDLIEVRRGARRQADLEALEVLGAIRDLG